MQTAGSLLEKKNEKKVQKPRCIRQEKHGFKRVGGPPPAAVPDDPITQTVRDILQRRFNPLPNPYDDEADLHDKTHPFKKFHSCSSEFLSNK